MTKITTYDEALQRAVVERIKAYAGKALSDVRNPNLTAREAIMLADWIAAAPEPVEAEPFDAAKAIEQLIPNLRQYRHNYGSEELVAAYELEGTQSLVANLQRCYEIQRDELMAANQRCVALQRERDQLLDALGDIINPIAAWQRDLKEGERLDGYMAVHMSEDPETYRRMAREAIAAIQGEK